VYSGSTHNGDRHEQSPRVAEKGLAVSQTASPVTILGVLSLDFAQDGEPVEPLLSDVVFGFLLSPICDLLSQWKFLKQMLREND